MPFADASLTAIRFASETTYATAPTGTYLEIRQVNEDLGQDKEVVVSDEITADRRNPDNIQVGSSASGDLTCELTGGIVATVGESWDQFFRSALGATGYSTPVGAINITGVITPTNGADADEIVLTLSAGTFPAFATGEFTTWSGFDGVRSVLNSVYKVESGGGTGVLTLSCGPRVPASPGTQATATVSAFTFGAITDGTTLRSFSIERQYSVASQFALMTGKVVTGFDIDAQAKKPIRITWHFMGKDEQSKTTTIAGAVTAVSTAKSMTLVSDLRSFSLDENGHDYFLNSFKLSFKNGAYAQDERAGTIGTIGVGLGTFECTGRYEFYYDNATLPAGTVHDQFQKFQDKELHVGLGNANGEWFLIHLPRINWTAGRRATPGKDQAVKGWVEFRAAKGPTYLIKVGRL